jgi:exodeoxyribonuclease VII large subunit
VGKLETLSPLRVLARGYSITRSEGAVLLDASSARIGENLNTILFRGRVTSRVESVEKDDGKEKERDPGAAEL